MAENVELVEVDRGGIGLSPVSARGESGKPNGEGHEVTTDAPNFAEVEQPEESSEKA